MRLKILSKRIIITLAGFALSLALFLYFSPKSSTIEISAASLPTNAIITSVPPTANTPTLDKQENVKPGLPIRLKIPEINVDASIEYVGLKANGEMDVPKDPAAVAWLQIGNRPGDIGSAVIAGHYGIWRNGKETVFNNLNKLKRGDNIYVEDEKGMIITFVVREKRSYSANADASSVFTSSNGKSHLNLVTCQGWDKVSESYVKRLVVFTDKE